MTVSGKSENSGIETQLVPILREGIDVIKMILYQELKTILSDRYPHVESDVSHRLAAAMVNRLFGARDGGGAFASFEKENRRIIERELDDLATTCDHLRIPLTDALRIQFLCDSHEGVDGTAVLARAGKLNVLIPERHVPLPGAFMSIVRRFGTAYNLLEPQ